MDSLTPIPTKMTLIFFLRHFPQSQPLFQVFAVHFYLLRWQYMTQASWKLSAFSFGITTDLLSFLQWKRYCREHLSITFSRCALSADRVVLRCVRRQRHNWEIKCNSSARGQILQLSRLQKSEKSCLPL